MHIRFLSVFAVLALGAGSIASQPEPTEATEAEAAPIDETAEAPFDGLLPIKDYTGKLGERAWLLGDFNGSRTDLANKGIQFNVEWTHTLQSIVDGGRDERSESGGSLDYNLTFDLQKMDVMPGAIITLRAESRYGDTVNSIAGPLLPVNTDGYFPIDSDNSIDLALTTFSYTQYLSPTLGVFLGKVDTLDGDLNEFASGRGVTQFMNAAFNFNPVTGLTVPYSTLAAGVFWAPDPNMQLTASIMNAADSSTSSGFDDFGDGWLASAEFRFQYRLGALPGGQTITALASNDTNFTELGSRLVFIPGEGLAGPTTSDSWFVSWNGWQYIYTEEASEGPINLLNRTPDLQGIGLFARFGVADENTNPIDWSASVGIGGRGIIPGRDDDTFGVGYFYTHIQPLRILSVAGIDNYTQGIEGFYNIALTPSSSLTLDCQVIESAFPRVDTTVILGMRLQLRF